MFGRVFSNWYYIFDDSYGLFDRIGFTFPTACASHYVNDALRFHHLRCQPPSQDGIAHVQRTRAYLMGSHLVGTMPKMRELYVPPYSFIPPRLI